MWLKVGAVAAALALLIGLTTALYSARANLETARAERDAIAATAAANAATASMYHDALRHKDETIRRLRVEKERRKCSSGWKVTRLPDGGVIEECAGILESEVSSTAMEDAATTTPTVPGLAPIVKPSAVAARRAPWSVGLAAMYGGSKGWGAQVHGTLRVIGPLELYVAGQSPITVFAPWVLVGVTIRP